MKKWNILYILSAIIIIILIFLIFWNHSSKKSYEAEIHFMEIPIGHCTLIKIKERNILIGEVSEKDTKHIKEYLNSQKVNTISELIIASPKKDKIQGFESLLDDYTIEKIYLPHISDLDKETEQFLYKAKEQGISIYQINSGEEWSVGEAKLLFLRPSSDTTIPVSERKIIVKLILPKKSILLLPDMEKMDMSDLMLSSSKISSDIITINGNKRIEVLEEDFLNAVKPDLIVFTNNARVKEKELQKVYNWNSSAKVISIYEEGYVIFYGGKGKYSLTSRRTLNIKVQ